MIIVCFKSILPFLQLVSRFTFESLWRYNSFNIPKQEHPRGSIVEQQGLHQDGLKSLSYNSSKTLITITIIHIYINIYIYITFSNWKEEKFKLGQVASGSNIAQNHSSSIQEAISGHYLPKFTLKVDQKWNYVKLESVQTLLRITRLAHRKSYLIIISPNSLENLVKSKIRSNWSLFWPIWNHIWSLFASIHMQSWPKVKLYKLESVWTFLKTTHLAYMKWYLAIIDPNSHDKFTKYEIRSSYYLH